MTSLEANATRRFHWVEMIYFREWWGEQTPAKQASVRALVAAKRLVFLTGGLCMNDEAIAHHGAIIDQMTWGHRFINETFGPDALPNVGWQIDAFGHSAGYTSLTAGMGFKAMIGQKIDFQDQARRASARELEFAWTPDPSNQPEVDVFGHVMFDNTGGYSFTLPQKGGGAKGEQGTTIPLREANCTGGPPGGNGCCTSTCGGNCDSCAVELAASIIAARVAQMKPRYRHGDEHVFFAFGSDFQFQDAPLPFEAMEMVMAHVQSNPGRYGFKLIYSTPEDYFAAIGAPGFKSDGEDEDWPTFNDDLLPAAFSAHYIRSGFYTSRPASKASDRAAWAAGHAAKALEVLLRADGVNVGGADPIATAIAGIDASVGVHQHHDGLTGTDLEYVALNYANMIANATAALAPASAAAATRVAGLGDQATSAAAGCPERNVSVCPATAKALQEENGQIEAVLFNPLAHSRTEVVAIPVPVATVEAVDSMAKRDQSASTLPVEYEVHPSIMAATDGGLPFTLFVAIPLKPFETRTVTLRRTSTAKSLVRGDVLAPQQGVISLSVPTGASAAVDSTTGSLVSIADQPVNCSLEYYVPAPGTNETHGWEAANPCSTAYGFRPMPGVPRKPYGRSPDSVVTVYKGKLVQQTHTVVNAAAGVELAVRVSAGDASVQLITKLGPLDVSNGYGQEAVMEFYVPSIGSAGHFQTDANGLFMMQRTRRDNTSGFFPYVVRSACPFAYMHVSCSQHLWPSPRCLVCAVDTSSPSLKHRTTSLPQPWPHWSIAKVQLALACRSSARTASRPSLTVRWR